MPSPRRLAALLALLAACDRAPPEPAPSSLPAPPPAARPPAPTDGQAFRASDGSIYTDKLFWGLLTLEASPEPVTPAQAREVLRVIGLLEAKLRKNQYYDDQLVALLRPEQLAYTEARVAGLSAEEMHADFNPAHIHEVVDELEVIAGIRRPPVEVEVPASVPVPTRPLTISRMTSFMIAWDGMQADPALAVDAAQATRLLPYVDSYVRLKSMKQQTKRDILAALTEGQKRWIDDHPARDEEISDMTRLTARVKAAMEARADEAP